MTHHMAPAVAPDHAWFKSSYSQENGNACVEIADLTRAGNVGIRDSMDKTGPALVVPSAAWTSFLAEVRSGVWDFNAG